MRHIGWILLLLSVAMPAHSAKWVTLKNLYGTRLFIDKQSITQELPYVKAWIKAEYQTPQQNIEAVDRRYNQAKALWYFDCAKQKAATIQVFQYLDQELIYSAGVEPKNADFIEPVPESEVDLTKQYVCLQQSKQEQAKLDKAKPAQTVANKPANTADKNKDSSNAETTPVGDSKEAPKAPTNAEDPNAKKPSKDDKAEQNKADQTKEGTKAKHDPKDKEGVKDKENAKTKDNPKDKEKTKDKDGKTASKKEDAKPWNYQGEQDPSHWATLNPDYALCASGKNQSPIHLQNTIPAALKPLKMLQKFPAKQIAFQQHAIDIVMGEGNMMVLDQQPYQLKHIVVHSPAEHQIKQKNYAAELQYIHQNKQGDTVILAVMVEEGEVHIGLDKILQLPIKADMPASPIKERLTPAEFMPGKSAYMRYSGSLTTPPCTEGVQWVIMKAPIQASKQQLTQLSTLLGSANNRPIQATAGRMILE